jgi:hypothetical protein
VAVSKAPTLPRLPDLAELGDRVHDRLADRGWIVDEDAEIDDDEPRDEEDEDDPDEDDLDDDEEPPDEDVDDEKSSDEADGDDEDEGLDEDDDGEESSPTLAPGKVRRARGIDPVARPPEPPDRDGSDRGSAATTTAGSE